MERIRASQTYQLGLIGLTGMLALLLYMAGPLWEDRPIEHPRLAEDFGQQPLSFESNQGQTDAQVRFLSRGRDYTLFLTPEEAVLSLRQAQPEEGDADFEVVRLQVLGANPAPEVVGRDPLPSRSHYFQGNDPGQWHTGIEHYGKVEYQQVYPGIDLVYYGNERQLEYDFVVAPGADPSAIRLRFEGVEQISLEEAGSLALHLRHGEMVQHAPIVYQEVGGQRLSVDADYVLLDESEVAFAVGAYDPDHTLVIDPVLGYSTLIGGVSDDYPFAGAADAAGNSYAVGTTFSPDFPVAGSPPYQTSKNGSLEDNLIVKVDPNGQVVWATYLGGSVREEGQNIAVDGVGNVYVVGNSTSTNFPLVNPLFGPGPAGGGFLAKFDVDGQLLYSTFLGSENGMPIPLAIGVAVDGSGNMYVAGITDGQLTVTRTGTCIRKINAAGTALVYARLFDGVEREHPDEIVVDAANNAYIAGRSKGGSPISNAQQPTYGGGDWDAYVIKLDANGNTVFATYLGGSGIDTGYGIDLDSNGNVVVVGQTDSGNFPMLNPFQGANAGAADAFITTYSPAGTLLYSSYLGSPSGDAAYNVAANNAGIYVTGQTNGSGFPITADAYQSTFAGANDDAFLSQLSSDGSQLLYSTYLGSQQRDIGRDVALDAAGNIYLTGQTQGADFPTTLGQAHGGGWDVFMVKFFKLLPLVVSVPDTTATYNESLTIPVSVTNTTGHGIVSAEVFVSYDGDLLTALSTSATNTLLVGNWSVETNIIVGNGTNVDTVKIAMATDDDVLSGEGTLININFQVADRRSPASSLLTLEHVLFNDGDPVNTTVDGSVALVGLDGSIASTPATIIPREDITITVTDADEDRDSNSLDSFDVAVVNGAQTETLTLTETGNSTGVFAATISTVFSLGAISGDGIIQAKAGDAIVSTYDDSLDAAGNTVSRSDQTDVIGGTDGAIRVTIVSQPGDLVRIRVTDADLNADPGNPESVVVTAVNNQTNESEAIALNEDGANSDIFFGTVATTLGTVAGTNDDGTFNTQKGDVLVVTYDDVVTALGSTASLVDDDEVVNPFGDADGNFAVQAFDAAKVLQHVLSPFLTGLDSLSANLDLLAFDPVLGKITPFDASLILQKRVGLIGLFPVQEDEADNHPQPETDNSVPKRVSDERLLSLQLNGGYLSVWADERSEILSGDLLLEGIKGPVQMGEELSEFLSASAKTDDGLRIVFAGASPVSGPGELLRIYPGVGPDKVQLIRASFNDGRIAVQAQVLAAGYAAPAAYILHANRPNPFNPETAILFELPREGTVRLEVFDVLGQRVKTLVAQELSAGAHQVVWDGRNERGTAVGNGLYLYRLEAGGFVQLRRMLLLK